jgi:class 3 adenylate cyclase
VRARLRPYHARLRQEIERYGGTVEKFIGDAVMGVFGAPVAHEDDAERAVRAGLRLPTPAATQYPRSPDQQGLNAYDKMPICRGFTWPARARDPRAG